MSDINWDDIMAVTFATINPTIQREVEKARQSFETLYPRFYNPHPWKVSLRDMARMLEGEINLPHIYFNDASSRASNGCPDCNQAHDLRATYLLSKEHVQQLS